MATRRPSSRDRTYLAGRLANLRRDWKPGDRCLAARGRAVTTVERVEGEIVYLANGDSLHWSNVRPEVA